MSYLSAISHSSSIIFRSTLAGWSQMALATSVQYWDTLALNPPYSLSSVAYSNLHFWNSIEWLRAAALGFDNFCAYSKISVAWKSRIDHLNIKNLNMSVAKRKNYPNRVTVECNSSSGRLALISLMYFLDFSSSEVLENIQYFEHNFNEVALIHAKETYVSSLLDVKAFRSTKFSFCRVKFKP